MDDFVLTVGDVLNPLLIQIVDHDTGEPRDLTNDTLTYAMVSDRGTAKAVDGAATSQQVDTGIFALYGITQAFPAVVSFVAVGNLAVNDVGYIEGVRGMTEINSQRARQQDYSLQTPSADTFQLRDIDSRTYSTYSSGGRFVNRGFVKITLGSGDVGEAGLWYVQVKRTVSGSTEHAPIGRQLRVRIKEPITVMR